MVRRPLKIEIDTLKNMLSTANAEVDLFQEQKYVNDAETQDEISSRAKLKSIT